MESGSLGPGGKGIGSRTRSAEWSRSGDFKRTEWRSLKVCGVLLGSGAAGTGGLGLIGVDSSWSTNHGIDGGAALVVASAMRR